MKAYLCTTGVIFTLVTIAHLARTPEISAGFDTDPWSVIAYHLLTLLSAALAVWAWRLFVRLSRSTAGRTVDQP
jgi:hypothetical protein